MESLKQHLVEYIDYVKTNSIERDEREKELFVSVVFYLRRVLKYKLEFNSDVLNLLYHFFERELKVTESRMESLDFEESILFYACKYESEYGVVGELLRKLSKRKL